MPIDFYTHIFLLFLPLIIANIFHMLVVRDKGIEKWAKPISVKLFGASKTWRGFIILPLLTAILTGSFNYIFLDYYLTVPKGVLLGFGLGFSYMAWELPNSFIKRRLGIENGQRSKKMPLLQVFIDKADSLIGVFLFYYWIMPLSLREVSILFILSMAIHMSLSYLLFIFKIKKSF